MDGTTPLLAGFALVASVAAGLVVHEWTHAATLRAAGVDYEVEFFPGRSGGVLGLLASCPWALVRPRPAGHESPWALRLAALAPFSLAVPVGVLGATGGVPGGEAPIAAAAVVGWLACAIPSPQDFSVAFYAHRLLSEAAPDPPANSPIDGTDILYAPGDSPYATTDSTDRPANSPTDDATPRRSRADTADD